MHKLVYVYPTLRAFKSKRQNYTFCSKKRLGVVFSLYLDKRKCSLLELSNQHKKLLDCQFKIAKLHAIISTSKKVFSSV